LKHHKPPRNRKQDANKIESSEMKKKKRDEEIYEDPNNSWTTGLSIQSKMKPRKNQ
jgi:hypothetical protein